MAAFWQLKKSSNQQVLYLKSVMPVAAHKKPNRSVAFISLNVLCPSQTGRFDIYVKAVLADPGCMIYLCAFLTLGKDSFNSGGNGVPW